jgi:hypothetical protein
MTAYKLLVIIPYSLRSCDRPYKHICQSEMHPMNADVCGYDFISNTCRVLIGAPSPIRQPSYFDKTLQIVQKNYLKHFSHPEKKRELYSPMIEMNQY